MIEDKKRILKKGQQQYYENFEKLENKHPLPHLDAKSSCT